MLGEGFLMLQCYKEESKTTIDIPRSQTQRNTANMPNGVPLSSNSGLHTISAEPIPSMEEPGPTRSQGLGVASQPAVGVSIPGCSPVPNVNPPLSVSLDACSLFQRYPDIRLGYETGELDDPDFLLSMLPISRSSMQPPASGPPRVLVHADPVPQESQGDQGYLEMGASVTTSLDLPGPGHEPMSNSLLNGWLEQQLDEVYLQHLTDSLARYNSQQGNSLLRGLVPPPQPNCGAQGPESLETGLEDGQARQGSKTISYLNTQNAVPCSSNFSSPVLRISEADSTL